MHRFQERKFFIIIKKKLKKNADIIIIKSSKKSHTRIKISFTQLEKLLDKLLLLRLKKIFSKSMSHMFYF